MIAGIAGSYSHPENGMVRSDMEATLETAGYCVPKNWAWSQTEPPKDKFKRLFRRGPEYLPERH